MQLFYIMNRVPMPILENKFPHYLLYNEEPDLHVLRIFRTLAYASTFHSGQNLTIRVGNVFS